jgi:hypothetical protein
MAKTTPRQRKTTGRVMHEFKHGELKSGRGGKGGKVNSRKQAVAIALREAGASKYQTKSESRKSLAKSKGKESRGRTSRKRKASRMSERVANAKARERWAARTRPGRRAARARRAHRTAVRPAAANPHLPGAAGAKRRHEVIAHCPGGVAFRRAWPHRPRAPARIMDCVLRGPGPECRTDRIRIPHSHRPARSSDRASRRRCSRKW